MRKFFALGLALAMLSPSLAIALGTAVAPPGPSWSPGPGGPVFVNGDWPIAGNVTLENKTYILRGNLTVYPGGTLNLQNVTFRMDSRFDGEFRVQVKGGGSLYAYDLDGDPSTRGDAPGFTANNTTNQYLIVAERGSVVDMRNSLVSYCGFSGASKGFSVDTDAARFESIEFARCYVGIYASGSPFINNVTFSACQYGIELYKSNATISNCTFNSSTGWAIWADASAPKISDLRLVNSTNGILLSNTNVDIVRANCTSVGGTGLYCMNSSPTFFDSSLGGAVNVRAAGVSYPGMVNTSFDKARATLENGLYVSIGSYSDFSVVDDLGAPAYGARLLVVDGAGTASYSGWTDATGHVRKAVVRGSILTRAGETARPTGYIYAYKETNYTIAGMNSSAPGAVVRMAPSGQVRYLPGYNFVSNATSYRNITLIIDRNLTAIYGADLSMDNVTMLLDGPSGEMANLALIEGFANVTDSRFWSGCAPRALQPSQHELYIAAPSNVTLSSCDVVSGHARVEDTYVRMVGVSVQRGWPYAVRLDSAGADLKNISVELSGGGLEAMYATFRADNVAMDGVTSAGMMLMQSRSYISKLEVANATYGILSQYAPVEISDSRIWNCGYGVYASGGYRFAAFDIVVVNCEYGGVSLMSGVSARLERATISDCPIGVDAYAQDVWIEGSSITGNQCGIYARGTSPTVANTTLSNGNDAILTRGCRPAFLNATFNQSTVSVPDSSYVSVGAFAKARVYSNGTPVSGALVSSCDGYSANLTDASGMTGWIAFESRQLTYSGTVYKSPQRFVAVYGDTNASYVAEANANLTNGAIVNLTLPTTSNSILWDADREVHLDESHVGETIIIKADVLVMSNATLSFEGCKIYFWRTPDMSFGVFGMEGNISLVNVTSSPLASRRPGTPSEGSFGAEWGFSLTVARSTLLWSSPVTVYGRLAMSNTSIQSSAVSGVSSYYGNLTVTDSTIDWCAEGISAQGSVLSLRNVTFSQMAGNGLYAQGGAAFVDECKALRNNYGAFLSDVEGRMDGGQFELNQVGAYASGSAFDFYAPSFEDNTRGLYLGSYDGVVRGGRYNRNQYGIMMSDSSPTIVNASTSRNSFGIYAYQSSPYIVWGNSTMDAYGIYSSGRYQRTVSRFDSGLTDAIETFIGPGQRVENSFTMPVRARLLNATMYVSGVQLKNVPIVSDPASQMNPSIYGDRVAYSDHNGGNWNIRYYNLTMDSDGDGIPNYMEYPHPSPDPAVNIVTNDTAINYDPDISGDVIVWTHYNDATEFDIYAHSISNGTTWQVAQSPSVDWQPSLDGYNLAWTRLVGNRYQVFLKNIFSPDETQVTKSDNYSFAPDIWGERLVWYDYMGSPGSEFADLFMYNLTTGNSTDISDDLPQQYLPALYGNTLAWQDDRKGDTNGDGYKEWDIYVRDLGTGSEQCLTNDTEASFAPNVWGDKVVWYWHDRTYEIWSVMMRNLTTNVTEYLEGDTKGDSWPVTFGPRVAWLNKSIGNGDIYVYDQRYVGYPTDPWVDVGDDGLREWSAIGECNNRTQVDKAALTATVQGYLRDTESNATATIPIRMASSSTGRLRLYPLAIKYELQGLATNFNISSSTSAGLYCYDSDFRLVNSTLPTTCPEVRSAAGADPELLNCTFSGNFAFNDAKSNVTIRNYLDVRTLSLPDAPLPNATVRVSDNGRLETERMTNAGGLARWIRTTDRMHNSTGAWQNTTTVQVVYGLAKFGSNPRDVDMGVSHMETFSADLVPPWHEDEWPVADGRCSQTHPTISVRILDDMGIDPSSIKLFVNGYKVFYNITPVGVGFNVSYFFEPGASDGEVIRCRVNAKDTYGNSLAYWWNFTVDLTAPVILWTQPIDGAANVSLYSNFTVRFSEPMDKTSAEGAFSLSPTTSGTFFWPDGSTMVFNPNGSLLPVQVYSATVGTGARDLAGNNLASSHLWSFRTEADVYGPDHAKECPAPHGYATSLYPVISLWVTDVSGVAPSSIRLYVNTYSIYYNLTAVTGGYNVSYFHESGFALGENVTCRIVAQDALGNRLDFTWKFTVVETYVMPLQEGWNLVSLPLVQVNTSIERALSSISGYWDYALWYDPLTPSHRWRSYYTGRAPELNDLRNLDHRMGFWLRTRCNVALTVYGIEPNVTNIMLRAGWNLVGYPTQNAKFYTVSHLKTATGATLVEGYDPAMEYLTNILPCVYVLRTGAAYWVYVPSDAMWTIDW